MSALSAVDVGSGDAKPNRPIVLLVEKDSRETHNLKTTLGGDWRLVGKQDGVAAVHHMMEHGLPDILITELDFPAMSGLELIRWVRGAQTSRYISILVHGPHLNEETERQCREAGVDGFVVQTAEPQKWESAARLARKVHETKS
jgi:DNA-binding NarL/FixJ family response regulator